MDSQNATSPTPFCWQHLHPMSLYIYLHILLRNYRPLTPSYTHGCQEKEAWPGLVETLGQPKTLSLH